MPSIATVSRLATAALVLGLCVPSWAQSHNHNHGSPSDNATPTASNGAREPSPQELRLDLKGSQMIFKRDTVSVGEIFDTEPVDAEFTFKNSGADPLEIRFIKPACGCTVPEMDKTVYEPGETGTIKVTFDPKGKRGSTQRGIRVYTNSKLKPVHQIFVDAVVKPIVIHEPATLSYNIINKGRSATREVTVYGRFPEFKVTRATVQNPGVFDVELIHLGEVEHKGEQLWASKILVTTKESARPDDHRTGLSIRTNDDRKPIFSVGVYARVIGDLELKPVRMTLGRLVVGDLFEREIILRSRSGEAFEIRGVNTNTAAIDVDFSYEPVDPESRTEWIIRADGKVVGAAPRFRTEINVATDVPDEELLTIQTYGQLRAR